MAAKMIAILLVFTFSGVKLDEYLNTDFQWFTMSGALLGAGFAMYSAIIDLLK